MAKSEDPSLIVKEYYSNPDIIERYASVGLWLSEDKLIDMFFKPGSSILDLGCGAGRTSIALAGKGYQVTGIDLIPAMIDRARIQAEQHQARVHFAVMDVTDMSFEDGSFDNVLFSFNGFEQIPRAEKRYKVVSDVYRILRPGGYHIMTIRSGLAIGRRMFGWAHIGLSFIVNKFSPGGVANLEFGDKIRNKDYHHYLNPFKIRETAHEIGFKSVYFNSHKNIIRGRKPSFWTNLSADKSLFFVFQKPTA